MGDERDVEIALCASREADDALVVFDPRDRRVVDLNHLRRHERQTTTDMKPF